jgi:hypothetical protein
MGAPGQKGGVERILGDGNAHGKRAAIDRDAACQRHLMEHPMLGV